MSTTRRTMRAAMLPVAEQGAKPSAGGDQRLGTLGSQVGSQSTIAILFIVLLLVLATTSQGAFQVSRWAPLSLFALAVLIGALLVRGTAAVVAWPARLALTGIWGLAGFSMLSMLWAQSPGDAFAGGNRLVLYAAVATLPFVLPLSRQTMSMAGWAITAGIGAIAIYILDRLLSGDGSVFLAGRLNAPIDYRNATALLFALPVLPCVVAAASRTYLRSVRAAMLGLSTLCLGLSFLTQSRGILIGLVAGELVILTCGPDRVRRAWVSLIPLGAVALGSGALLRPFHAFDGGDGFVATADIRAAAVMLALLTAGTLVVGMVIALFDNGLRPNGSEMRHVRRAARVGLVIAVAGTLAATGNPVTYLRHKWDQFTSLQSTTPTSTRLLTVGGQRYDLWRVAVKEFESHPILGVGTDNYSFGYYRDRRTNRNLDDPHSLVFAVLSENGLVGIGLFALFVAGLGTALFRGLRRLTNDERRPAVAAAAAGTVLLGQSTVDWIWLIPGLTAIGILSLSLAAAQASPRSALKAPRVRIPRGVLTGAAGAVLMLAVAGTLALFLSDAYVQRARSQIYSPAAELSAARTAGSLDPWSVTPLYLQASALESMGNRPAAYQALRSALGLEPQNSATLGVIGDFEARGHHFALARSYYRRALALDPLDTGLQQLSRFGVSAPPGRHRSAPRRHR
jgi:hypothetical protein